MRLALAVLLALGPVPALAAPKAKPAADPAVKARIVALVLRRTDFGSISLIPV